MRKYIILGSVVSATIVISLALYLRSEKTQTQEVIQTPVSNVKFSSDEKIVCGWAPWWELSESAQELKQNEGVVNSISPFIYEVNEEGAVQTSSPHLDELQQLLDLNFKEVIPTISNNFDNERIENLISDSKQRERHINELVNITLENDYSGIEIDYEQLLSKNRDYFSNFIKELAEKLHHNEKRLSVTVHPKTTDKGEWEATAAQDWEEIAKHADYVRIMAYDYHWAASQSGPVAPLSWVEDVTEYAKATIPKEKRILGLGLYGYEWLSNRNEAETKTLLQIQDIRAKNRTSEYRYSSLYNVPSLTFIRNGEQGVIWYEDKTSVSKKIDLAEKEYRGICIWKLGGITKDVYRELKAYN